ncbi:MAG: acyl carrier protein [Eubacteriales bacterium]|nr:acyl carrier protein [Eubacteriales bacterium]MCI6971359.1 acyl carrier protein [Eubacterium sp.]MDD7572995.1 acyl carrier protein [Eubacteriales bacterium]MDY5355268.1 acyl carrier protein [Eubacteriales bacterium]
MFDEIKSIMTETLSIPEDQITPEANLEADLGISSLELYELGGRIMEVYDIDIEEDEIHTFITVNDIVEYVSAHTK